VYLTKKIISCVILLAEMLWALTDTSMGQNDLKVIGF